MRFLFLVGRLFEKLATWLTIVSVAVMALVVLFQVIMRYFFRDPLVWGDEMAKYSLAFMTFIGASVALRRGELACMDLVVDKLPKSVQKPLAVLVTLLNICLISFLLYCSINLMGQRSVLTQVSPAMGVPMQYIYSCLPIGMSLMIIQSMLGLFEQLTGKKHGG